jgi:hypothetical protein
MSACSRGAYATATPLSQARRPRLGGRRNFPAGKLLSCTASRNSDHRGARRVNVGALPGRVRHCDAAKPGSAPPPGWPMDFPAGKLLSCTASRNSDHRGARRVRVGVLPTAYATAPPRSLDQRPRVGFRLNFPAGKLLSCTPPATAITAEHAGCASASSDAVCDGAAAEVGSATPPGWPKNFLAGDFVNSARSAAASPRSSANYRRSAGGGLGVGAAAAPAALPGLAATECFRRGSLLAGQ